MKPLIVLSTIDSLANARKLSQTLLSQRVAACVSISSPMESHYWWKGKKEKAKEYLLIIKTKATAYKALEKALKKHHPYDVPEILALPATKGSRTYLSWLAHEVH